MSVLEWLAGTVLLIAYGAAFVYLGLIIHYHRNRDDE